MTQSASSYNLSATTTRSPAERLPVLFLQTIILAAQQLFQGLLNIACLQYLATNRKKKASAQVAARISRIKGSPQQHMSSRSRQPIGLSVVFCPSEAVQLRSQ